MGEWDTLVSMNKPYLFGAFKNLKRSFLSSSPCFLAIFETSHLLFCPFSSLFLGQMLFLPSVKLISEQFLGNCLCVPSLDKHPVVV